MSAHKPKILQVGAALHQGGVEQGIVELSVFLKELRWDPLVASAGGGLVPLLEAADVPHFKLPLHRRAPWFILYNMWQLCRILKRERPDLVHARSRAPAWAAWGACKICRVPFVTGFHGTYGLQNRAKKFYNSVMVRGVATVANSRFIKQHILENYAVPEEQVYVAQRGIDETRFPKDLPEKSALVALRAKHSLPAEVPLILMPGRLTRWKGQHVLVEALGQIRDIPWVAVFVGASNKNATYREELLKRVTALNMENRVFFVGQQNKDMPLFYAAASLSISASIQPEAFGRVALESQAMGTPVIATAHGGSLETVRDGLTGWLVKPNDATTLAASIKEALAQPKHLKEMGNSAYTWSRENFSSLNTCKAEVAVYKKILGEP